MPIFDEDKFQEASPDNRLSIIYNLTRSLIDAGDEVTKVGHLLKPNVAQVLLKIAGDLDSDLPIRMAACSMLSMMVMQAPSLINVEIKKALTGLMYRATTQQKGDVIIAKSANAVMGSINLVEATGPL